MAQTSNKMAVGFNHNVKHQGKVYHVQTEDSGVDNPHVITHLFVGGNILASKRASYAELLALPDLAGHVRALMEAQHKEMLRALVNGAFDAQTQDDTPPGPRPGDPQRFPGLPSPDSPPTLYPTPPLPPPTMSEEGIGSIFAEDLMSEKSLDEVILSYLAGETEPK